MILDTKHIVIRLAYRALIPVEQAAGAQIRCTYGRIWITEHGSADDVVLHAGQSYDISHSGIAIVQGLRESIVTFWGAPASQGRSGLAARVASFCTSTIWGSAAGHA